MPEARALSALRQDIDRKPDKIKRVLTNAGIRKWFFGGIPDDKKKAVKAFVNQTSNRSNALKKHPKVSRILTSEQEDIGLSRSAKDQISAALKLIKDHGLEKNLHEAR